jgi:ABC-type branched-subunit amino acid transport system substrate-binding protein
VKRKKQWGAVVVATLLVAALVSTATSAGAGVKAASTRGVTDKEVKVGALVSEQIFGASVKGAQARIDRENDKGGVFGRKINIATIADDKFDPTTNVQVSRQLVTADQVFAIVPVTTIVLGSGDFLAQQKVPFFGWGISPQFCGNKWGYGFTGCVSPATPKFSNPFMPLAAAKALGKDPKGLTLALQAEDTDAAKSGNATLASGAEQMGMKVVYNKANIPAPPATTGDFTPFVQDMMTSNGGKAPDIVILLLASIPSTLGLQKGLQDAGFKGPIENTQTYDAQLAAPSKGGSVYVQFGAFETADNVAGVKQMVDDFDKAGVAPSVLAAVGYFSADMFIAALKKAGKNLTVDGFQKAASRLKYNVKNTAGPTTFPKNYVAPGTCGTLVTSNGTGYDVTVPYFCAPVLKYKA